MGYYLFDFKSHEDVTALVEKGEYKFRRQVRAVCEWLLNEPRLRFVALSGPSCSGKTTTSGIIADSLSASGKEVLRVSIDDFFLDRDFIRERCRQLNMAMDLDSVDAIDLPVLRAFIHAIDEGQEAMLPHFDFISGKRDGFDAIAPSSDRVVIFEGIQAIYPQVVNLFQPSELLKIYISVEKVLDSPFGKWLPRERRLLRRLLRDSLFRGVDTASTFRNWGGVVRNEISSIAPYRDGCDMTVDSGMPYEVCVLKEPLIKLLSKTDDTHESDVVSHLLIEKLNRFPTISRDLVPADSVLREFIGQ